MRAAAFFVWAWGVTEATSGGTRIPLRGDLIRRFAPPSPCAGKALGGALRAAGRMCHPEEGNPTKDLEGAGRVYRSGQGERNRASGARSFDSLCSLRMTAGAAKRQWGSIPAWGVTEATSGGTRIPLRGDLIRRFAPPSPCAGKALGGALRAAEGEMTELL